MNCFSATVDIASCVKLFDEEIRFSLCPKRNRKKLEWEMDTLRRAKEDVMTTVQEQEQVQLRRRCKIEVRTWLRTVESLDNEMLERVRDLRSQRIEFGEDLLRNVPPDPIVHVPYPSSLVIGVEKTLSEIRTHLKDEQVRTIGIFGLGGIGKTTVLKKIEGEMLNNNTHDFNLVIWVLVSREVDITKIQNQIAQSIGISFSPQEEEYQRAWTLCKALSKRKFLLLIDDVWQSLDLRRIGIPLPYDEIMGRIIFTTRSEQTCIDMDTQIRVRMSLLNPEQSLALFRHKLQSSGAVLDDPSIRPSAEYLIAKCGGLPLALITVARAVATYTMAGEWEDAAQNLRSTPEQVRGMDDVMRLVKFSFDHLDDDETRSCLSYCSLYHEDANIYVERLIKKWVGEGLLDLPGGSGGSGFSVLKSIVGIQLS